MTTIRLPPAVQWVIGEQIIITSTFVTEDDVASDPDTIDIAVKLPDGTFDNFTKSDMDQVATGIWRFTYSPPMHGRYVIRYETTGIPEAVTEQYFDVGYSSF